ncbi:MAG: VOC family protein [Ignavibacteriales bacterium]|nr:VOC family protein [Ignavibacteriales bacterium]
MSKHRVSPSRVLYSLLILGLLFPQPRLYSQDKKPPNAPEPGLLFYLSGDHGFNADYSAAGTATPNFLENVKIIPDGAKGAGFECGHKQLMTYRAPGNIYAERGTLSFFWRSREPVGETEFPIFRVAYADHSSWDMVWLRIDYNGHGFDAFVTDVNLARIRISHAIQPFPQPKQWIHLALTWDETAGIRFYADGKLVAQKDSTTVLYAGLDQFGPHSRIISPYQVQSAYNFQRGGDIDEVRIYDRMLSDANITQLAKHASAGNIPDLKRNLKGARWQSEWRLRYGWNRAGDIPPYLDERSTHVRKIEIQNAYDLKRWWWKGTDGIRETSWPGVYNRSRLPGRNDYFQLPDWDCYSQSGNAITFSLPDETWNHVEISGGAWGTMTLTGGNQQGNSESVFTRPRGQEKTVHRLQNTVTGGELHFKNGEQETPIGELSVYHVEPGNEPRGERSLRYFLHGGSENAVNQVASVLGYINGRFAADERSTMIALPVKPGMQKPPLKNQQRLPLIHIIIPYDARAGSAAGAESDSSYDWATISGGLDGVAIDLPPLSLQPTQGTFIPMNIQVRDPLWPNRSMLDFSFSVKPGEARTLWLDTRDRILPKTKSLYLVIASDAPDFAQGALEGAQIRVVFKDWKDAYREHVQDRFTQVRDNYAFLVEERPDDPRLNIYNRFEGDVNDLLRVDSKHYPGQNYWYDLDHAHGKPLYVQPAVPEGIPAWAFRQIEDLRYFKRFVLWWIDNRQIGNGELGGGLSDDDDLTNCWPGAALMGCEPGKISGAVLRLLDAIYENGMLTHGLSTIQTDGLHAHEEGIEAQTQAMLVDYGSPKQVERIMETVRALDEKVILKNKAGHRHFRSSYFSGTRMADESVWEWSLQPQEFLLLQPVLTLADFNGNPRARQLAIDVADGLLAHARKDNKGKIVLDSEINFTSDSTRPSPLGTKAILSAGTGDGATISTSSAALQLLWWVYRTTGEVKYLQPLLDLGESVLGLISNDALNILNLKQTWGHQIADKTTPEKGTDLFRHLAWQTTGNKAFLEHYYADQAEASALREYINTEGSLWSDRVFAANRELQRSRLGGVALVRGAIHSGHAVSWKFRAPATDQSVAILVPEAIPSAIKAIAYTLDQKPVEASMTLWNIEPGTWEVLQGLDMNNDDVADTTISKQTMYLERTLTIPLKFEPRKATILTLRLQSRSTPYSQRPDLGISKEDVWLEGKTVHVKVHSLGSVASPRTTAVIMKEKKIIASVDVPAIQAPVDLEPRFAEVIIPVPTGGVPNGCSVQIDPENSLNEITVINNSVELESNGAVPKTAPVNDEVFALAKKPRPEHIAFNVSDPVAVAKWYCDNLGMKIVRRSPPPATTHFIADSAGTMTLELYRNEKAPIPDYATISHVSLHLAFAVDDVDEIRSRLLAARAAIAEDLVTTPSGDRILMLRDPWGLPIQFTVRVSPMLKPGGLRFEHLALNLADPWSAANWYVENLGMRVVRQGGAPSFTQFVADDGKNMMLEFSTSTSAPMLDLIKLNTVSIHVAFVVDDVRSLRTGLIEAGATLADEIRETNAGDQVLVLRDPWGLPIQFIKRGEPLLK